MGEVTMPKLSDTMEEGKILRWRKQAGDSVEAGEILAEVETDKADMEIEAGSSGVLRELRVAEGELAAVGAVIALIEDGPAAGGSESAGKGDGPAAKAGGPAREKAGSAPTATGAASERAKAPPAAASPASGARAGRDPETAPSPAPAPEAADSAAAREARATLAGGATAGSSDGGRARKADGTPVRAPTGTGDAGREGPPRVSPLARSRAEELGIDVTGLRGSGPGGRVTRSDVEAAYRATAAPPRPRASAAPAPQKSAAGAAPSSPSGVSPSRSGTVAVREALTARRAAVPSAGAKGGGALEIERVPLSRMRTSIARRMAESKREAPHFYLTSIVDMERAVDLRASLKEVRGEEDAITYNHMVLKAVADSLVACPAMNARFAGDAIERIADVNLGVATAVADGLLVPVIHGADRLSIFEIAARARELGARAAEGGFSGNDLSGATFSVSNLGMFDVESFAAVINPPHAGILAVGSVKPRPVVRDGALSVAHTMAMTLSCDHRTVDGVQGARFLAEVKRRLENPVSLLVGAAGG